MNDDPINRQEVERARNEMMLERVKDILLTPEADTEESDTDYYGNAVHQTSLNVNSFGNDELRRIGFARVEINYLPETTIRPAGQTVPEIVTVMTYDNQLDVVAEYTMTRDEHGSPLIFREIENVTEDESEVHQLDQMEELELQSILEAVKAMVEPPSFE